MTQTLNENKISLEELLKLQKKITKWKRSYLEHFFSGSETREKISYKGSIEVEGLGKIYIITSCSFRWENDYDKGILYYDLEARLDAITIARYSSESKLIESRYNQIDSAFKVELQKKPYEFKVGLI